MNQPDQTGQCTWHLVECTLSGLASLPVITCTSQDEAGSYRHIGEHTCAGAPAPLAANQKQPRKPSLFLFPPGSMLPQVLMNIQVEEPTVWLVCSRYLRPIDEQVVKSLPVQARLPLRCTNGTRQACL